MLVGELTYPFTHHPNFSQKSWAFVCREWEGEPAESDELVPEWHLLEHIAPDDRSALSSRLQSHAMKLQTSPASFQPPPLRF